MELADLFEKPRTRTCGDCTACCTTMGVKELEKPYHEPCKHLCSTKGKGCSIYEARPSSCYHWDCAWLMNIGTEDMRPDKIGFVLTANPSFVRRDGVDGMMVGLTLRPNTPQDIYRWKYSSVYEILREISVDWCLISIGYQDNVIAAFWRGEYFELTTGQMAELNAVGRLQMTDELFLTNDPNKKW